LSTVLSRFATTVAEGTLDIVIGIASGAVQLVFVLVAAFYLVKDAERLARAIDGLAPPGFEHDVTRLRNRVTDSWSAFLRSQLLLAIVVAVMTSIACMALGLRYPVVLGLLAGILEVVPGLGPLLAAIPAVLLALIVGSTYIPLTHFWTAVLVAGVYILIQQIENNLLVPRIMARGLDLHPLLVLIAILVGGNVAGILGILLAPPALATVRVIGKYIFARLYDRDPWVVAPPSSQPVRRRRLRPGLVDRAIGWLRDGTLPLGRDEECAEIAEPPPVAGSGAPASEEEDG
jgi:predicted PurR-regulated permease PerM